MVEAQKNDEKEKSARDLADLKMRRNENESFPNVLMH